MRKVILAAAVILLNATIALAQGTTYRPGQTFTVSATVPATCQSGDVLIQTGATPTLRICSTTNVWTSFMQTGASSSLPTGMLLFKSSGTCPTGTTEATDLAGRTVGVVSVASGAAGQTGGADSITPAGTNSAPALTVNSLTPTGTVSQPTFTGNSVISSAVSAGTPAGTNSTVSFTPAGTNGTVSITPLFGAISWPAGVPTFTGTPFTAVINHTHPVAITVQGGTTAAVTGTHIMTSTATGGSARAVTSGDAATDSNPAGGVSSITPAGTLAWPAGVPTVSGSPTTVPAQTFTGTQGTIPAETFTGSALGTHTHTTTATGTISQPTFTGGSITPTGSVAAPAFTGTSFDNRSAFMSVIACRVN